MVASWPTCRRTTSAAGIWAAISTWLVSSRARILPSIGSDSPWLAMRSPTTPSKGARTSASARFLRATSSWASATATIEVLFSAVARAWSAADCETMLRAERVSLSARSRAAQRELGARGIDRRLALVDLRLELGGLEAREQLALG